MLQKKGRKEKKSGQLTMMGMTARRFQLLLSVLCRSLCETSLGYGCHGLRWFFLFIFLTKLTVKLYPTARRALDRGIFPFRR